MSVTSPCILSQSQIQRVNVNYFVIFELCFGSYRIYASSEGSEMACENAVLSDPTVLINTEGC